MPIKESFLRTSRKFMLAKTESTYGIDAAPTGAANAILTQNLVIKPVMEFAERKTDRRALGKDLSLSTSKFLTFEFDVDLQSSGTLGAVPAWGKLMKACGYSQTSATPITGLIAAPASAGVSYVILPASASSVDGFYRNANITLSTPSAGHLGEDVYTYRITAYSGTTKIAAIARIGSAGVGLVKAISINTRFSINGHYATALNGTVGTIELAAAGNGASIIDDFYNGQAVKIISGTGAGQARLIGGYVGATRIATVTEYWDIIPDSTSKYSIGGLGVSYQPSSSSWDAMTLYGHMDGQLRAAVGARGNVSLKMTPNAQPMLHFTFTGLWVDPIAITDPSAVTSAFKLPITVSDQNTPTFTLANIDQRVYDFDVDTANDVKYRDVINATSVSIIDRNIAGNITIEAPPLSEKNWWLDTVQTVVRPLNIVHGVDAGRTIEIFAPRVQCFDPTDGDKDGVLTMQLKCSYLPVNGDDELTIIAR